MQPRYALATLVLALVAAGCAQSDVPELGEVTGRVTYNGEPVPGITVIYQAAGGRPSYGRTDEDGVYQMNYNLNFTGVKTGPATVMFDPFSSEPHEDVYAPGDPSVQIARSVPPSPLIKKIPQKYFEGFQTVTIEPGENEFNFEVGE